VEHAAEDRVAMGFARIPKSVARFGEIAAQLFVTLWRVQQRPLQHRLQLVMFPMQFTAVEARWEMVSVSTLQNVARRLAGAALPLIIAETTRTLK
jgi:hypothetical protein